jgi:hypothetical protein
MLRRRVICRYDNSVGTAVQSFSRNRYRIEWDEPTPYQDEAKVIVPSKMFEWENCE